MVDIRDELFRGCMDRRFSAAVTAEREGILAGMPQALERAAELGLTVAYSQEEGSAVSRGEKLLVVQGNPKQLALAEECLMGLLSKASGIATAARRAVATAQGRLQIVAGAWKKMPPSVKDLVRGAVSVGGASFRIAEPPFLYLDKNYIRMLGGVASALEAARPLGPMPIVIQLKSKGDRLTAEAELAARQGASILMVDTGREEDLERVSLRLRALGLREQVRLAFAKGIQIDDIPSLLHKDIDILDIGAAIVDAPILDMRMDVVEEGDANLFQKTELWLEDVYLDHADLNAIADVVADTLGLDRREVLVIDVQPNHITLDLLRRTVFLEQIAGKETQLLERLAALKGVRVGAAAGVHSEGILGLIALPRERAAQALETARRMSGSVKARIAGRVMIFPTGSELISGSIRDTNSPLLQFAFEARDYTAHIGPALPDDAAAITAHLMDAVNKGYGVILTTGGTGAEGKDCTIEAVLSADRQAATPWVMKFQKGTGRHQKEGVRVAVGRVENTWLIALPGPNDEVSCALEVLLPMLNQPCDKETLAEALAQALRQVVHQKSRLYHHD